MLHIGVNLLDGSLGLADQCRGCGLVLVAGSAQRHVVLALGSLRLSDGGVVLRLGFIIFLCGYNLLVIQVLYAFERLLHDILLNQGLLPELIGPGYLLLARAVARLGALRLGGAARGLRLRHLCPYLGGIYECDGVAFADLLAFTAVEFGHMAGDHA